MSLRSLKTKLGFVLPAFVVSLLLAGCGGGDVDPVFVTPDAPEGVPVASFLGDASTVALGGSTQLAVQLDKRAQQNIDVRLFVEQSRGVEDDGNNGNGNGGGAEAAIAGSFFIPATVRVETNQSVAVFQVATTSQAQAGDIARITIVPGAAYAVGTPNQRSVTAVPALNSVRLVGPDLTVQAGEGFWYSVERGQCAGEVTVPLVATGDVDCFDVPASVTLAPGICTVAFASVAGECTDGSVGISILPPAGFGLDTYGFRTLQSGSESTGSPADSGTATVTLRN
jgi:hypothetical protein